jgi:hypothetical protein
MVVETNQHVLLDEIASLEHRLQGAKDRLKALKGGLTDQSTAVEDGNFLVYQFHSVSKRAT